MTVPADAKREFDVAAFYAQLDVERQRRGLTWGRVAAEAGVAPNTLSRIGKGHTPSVDGLFALAQWAGLDGWDAMQGDRHHRVTVDPRQRSGAPCVNGIRVSAEFLAGYVAAGDGVDAAAESHAPLLTREDVLVACWYQGTYGTRRWRKEWGEWAEKAHEAMWSGRWADVEDPPEWPERAS